MAIASLLLAFAFFPNARESAPVACDDVPMDTASPSLATVFLPIATEVVPLDVADSPKATELVPLDVELNPPA